MAPDASRAHTSVAATAALVLAGGQARRMGGGDKALRPLAGRPLLAHVLARIAPQAAAIALSANGDPARFRAFALPVLPDPIPGFPGPLAGILAGLRWAAAQGFTDLLAAPTDTPFLPPDLGARLHAGRADAPLACAASAGRAHPVVALWRVALAAPLAQALAAGERRVGAVLRAHAAVEVAFPADPAGHDPFANINTPEDLRTAECRLAAHGSGGAVCRNA